VSVYYGKFSKKNYRSSPHYWAIFSTVEVVGALILTKKMGWATFVAIFSQAHLAALNSPCQIPSRTDRKGPQSYQSSET
jgi:hypothetical protein